MFGHGAPTAPAAENQAYLDLDTDDLYQYTTSWGLVTNLRGSGIAENSRKLILLADEGPMEGYLSGARKVTTYSGLKPTSIIWYTDGTFSSKIMEKTIQYTGLKATTITRKVYATDGTTLLATVTDTITYSGLKETARTRVLA